MPGNIRATDFISFTAAICAADTAMNTIITSAMSQAALSKLLPKPG